jgi:integrase
MAKSHLQLVTPATVKRTVTPTRRPNADLRTREYLTEAEVERLLKATKRNRWAHRDATMILVAYRHGLRASKLADLRWDQVDFGTATLHVRRVKQGSPSTRPIMGTNCAGCSANRSPSRPLRSLRSGAHPSPPLALPACSSARASRRTSASRCIHTC